MLDTVIQNEHLNKYVTSFDKGKEIFLEGDDTQDLFILVSGHIDILKGNKKIVEITEKGSLFGEMSFLLGTKRTATVKASNDVKTIQIPKAEVNSFLHEFPDVARAITKLLAKRLDETNQVLYGLKEFCDQLPDAVITTDGEGKIITWNSASEKLYGRSWNQMCNKSVEEIYEEPEVYQKFLKKVRKKCSVKEKILRIIHPKKGIRFISTSTTLLYDDHKKFQGILSLGRDVTSVTKSAKQHRRTYYRFLPLLILFVLLFGGAFLGHSYFSKNPHAINFKNQELRKQLNKDYLFLKSTLANHFATGDRSKTHQLMSNFLYIHPVTKTPYSGLVLLDKNKIVFDACSLKEDTTISQILGSSYAGIEFQGGEDSIHKVLSLYRADKDHPMGQKGVEVAFEIKRADRLLGWLIFQMDLDRLENTYGFNEASLKQFYFNDS
ncbi:MAG: cyclic nucleotide-binding domain-containing protein [Deltaproteobacteria bacterium]|nr:cyclic nucleotide-binding domain-containing protein [Deltaproteobacteria bacterium]